MAFSNQTHSEHSEFLDYLESIEAKRDREVDPDDDGDEGPSKRGKDLEGQDIDRSQPFDDTTDATLEFFKQRIPYLVKICQKALNLQDQMFQNIALHIQKMLLGDFQLYFQSARDYESEIEEKLGVDPDEQPYLELFVESLRVIKAYLETLLPGFDFSLGANVKPNKQAIFIAKIYRHDIFQDIYTDEMFFQEFDQDQQAEIFAGDRDFEIAPFTTLFENHFGFRYPQYLFIRRQNLDDFNKLSKLILRLNTDLFRLYEGDLLQFIRPVTPNDTNPYMKRFYRTLFYKIVPKEVMNAVDCFTDLNTIKFFTAYQPFELQSVKTLFSSNGMCSQDDYRIIEAQMAVPFTMRDGRVVYRSVPFDVQRFGFFLQDFEERQQNNKLFRHFGHLLSIYHAETPREEQYLRQFAGEDLPRLYPSTDDGFVSEQKFYLVNRFWRVLLTENPLPGYKDDPAILRFGQEMVNIEISTETELPQELVNSYKNMVKRRIYNRVSITDSDIMPYESQDELFGALSEEISIIYKEELYDAYQQALGTFGLTTGMSIEGLLKHHLAPKEDQKALEKLFGKNQNPHPSMLLDEKFLKGPENAPFSYLSYRSLVLQSVQRKMDNTFFKDLETAVGLKNDASKKKELAQLSKSLVKRFKHLSL